MFKSLKIIPSTLFLKPVEHATIVLWLVALTQFVNFFLVNFDDFSVQWFVTAPVLVLATLVIAIRVNNKVPIVVIYLIGLMAIQALFVPELINSVMSGRFVFTVYNEYLSPFILLVSLYSLLFWVIFNNFLDSRFYLLIHGFTALDDNRLIQTMDFKKIFFYIAFIAINSSVLSCFLPSVFILDVDNVIIISSAIVFLFVTNDFITKQIRGHLLVIYLTLLIFSIISIEDNRIQIDEHILILWAFTLWFVHNFFATIYNRIFENKQIATDVWPWYGLFFISLNLFVHAPESIINLYYPLGLVTYLFLMLRNSTSALLSWLLILSLSWLSLFVLSADLAFEDPLVFIKTYGQELLIFSLILMFSNLLWEKYLNSFFQRFGWPKVSFRPPVLMSSSAIAIFFLLMNLLMALELISSYFSIFVDKILIENTSVLVSLVLMMLLLSINDRRLAHLLHLSVMIVFVFVWGAYRIFPVYHLFALLFLFWLILPRLLESMIYQLLKLKLEALFSGQLFSEQLLSEHLILIKNMLVQASRTWVYGCFVATALTLFYAIMSFDFDFRTMDLFGCILLLFIGSLILIKQEAGEPWYTLSYLLAFLLIVSLRLIVMGTVALNVYDTIGIFVISFIYYALNQRFTFVSPLISSDTLSKLLPLSALLTIPWMFGSLHSSLTLLLLGVFYLLINRNQSQGNKPIMKYSGLIFINIAIYLWIPMVSDYTDLMLLYVVPVVMSLLLITYLHNNDLSRQLQHRIRLVALSVFYVVFIADIFINEQLTIFILGLVLGLLSIIYGISSKIRVFLYTGVSFITIIIIGQLILVYPEGRLARALILMLFGSSITGLMIWFNIKREMLLDRIRLFRSDLDAWD